MLIAILPCVGMKIVEARCIKELDSSSPSFRGQKQTAI